MASIVAQGRSALQAHPDDLVATAIADLAPGDLAGPGWPVACDVIPRGHKIALRAIAAGEPIIKYGSPIGAATRAITAGEHVHSHNLTTLLAGEIGYSASCGVGRASSPARPDAGFSGYRRADGRVGTRNEIWIIPTVGCVNRTAERIARQASLELEGRVDGVHALTHPFGCSQLGDDLDRTRTVLAALARHPNAGGALVIGLGCESNQVVTLMNSLGPVDPERVRSLVAQTSLDEFEAGLAAVRLIAEAMSGDRREPCPSADLVLGLKCGGSDAFSGLTANPLLGAVSDRLDAAGGALVLTEIPEIFGAEHALMARAETPELGAAIGDMVNRFKRYFLDHGEPVHANPSPGNIAGGITTLEEKSLGAVQKAGRATVRSIIDYGQRAHPRGGLGLLCAPGNDAVSTTALAAAGATVILFTTGRGTPLGCPVPTLKISSNTPLAEAKPGWIDFNAGRIVDGEPLATVSDDLFDLVLRTASGLAARNERADERGIALWKGGVTL